jgi:hypothetical protein
MTLRPHIYANQTSSTSTQAKNELMNHDHALFFYQAALITLIAA